MSEDKRTEAIIDLNGCLWAIREAGVTKQEALQEVKNVYGDDE